MLFALRQPAILLGLVLGFLVGVMLRAALQRRLSSSRLRVAGHAPRRPVGRSAGALWATYLDPYGAVAAVVAGVGWGSRSWVRGGRSGSAVAPILAALAVHAVLAAIGFAAYHAAGGPPVFGHGVSVSDVLHGSVRFGSAGADVAAGFAMENVGCGLLALVPLPPLELGVLAWSRLPRSPGARRVAYHLLDEAWGVAVVLVGLLLPLAGQPPALLALIDIVADPLLRLV